MASHELLQGLIEATVASSAAIVLVLALRLPMRRMFGAQVAYVLWVLVPLMLVATLLPAGTLREARIPVAQVLALPSVLAVAAMPVQAGVNWRAVLLVLWLVGALALLGWLTVVQLRFMRSVGTLQRASDGYRVQHDAAGLPATVGVLRPRILLPKHFETQFSASQQQLMLAHEQTHIARGDHLWNALSALLQCVFWFNPLLHVAQNRYRQDQELACDACVMAQCPEVRSVYGHTLLQQQLTTQATPLGCHFGFSHPLKERILMLKQPSPSRLRRSVGGLLVATLVSGVSLVAWAAQPQSVPSAVPHAASAPRAQPQVNISSRMTNPPVYPADAMQEGKEGTVVLVVDINAQGAVTGAKVARSSGDARLDQAALSAVPKWTFNPAMENGKPVAGQVRVPVQFAMHEPPAASSSTDPRSAAINGGTSVNTNWGGYDSMMKSLRGNWITCQQPSTEGC